MNVNPVNSNTTKKVLQNGVDSGYVPDNTVITKATEIVAPLLRGSSLDVAPVRGERGDLFRDNEIPELDKALCGSAEDVERLLKFLLLSEKESQVTAGEKRLKSMLNKMDTEQKAVLRKVNESVEELKKQQDAMKHSGIFGWILTALSVIAAAITVVMTVGAATPLAIAGCALTCAATALGLTNQILTATGVKEKHCEKRAKEMMAKDPKLTEADALEKANKEWDTWWGVAQGILAVAALGVCIANLVKGTAQLAKLAEKLAQEGKQLGKLGSKAVQKALGIVQSCTGLSQAGLSIGPAVIAAKLARLLKEQAETEAELAQIKALIEKTKNMIEEEQDKLAMLLMQIQDVFSFLSHLNEGQNLIDERILSRMA